MSIKSLNNEIFPGVVLVEPEYLKDRKVYGHVLAAFRFGAPNFQV